MKLPKLVFGFFICLLLVLLTACRAKEAAATVSNEVEAIEIISLLNDFKIDATKELAGEEGAKQWRVMVSGADLTQSYQVLKDYGLPRPVRAGRDNTKSTGLFPAPEEVRQQQLSALESDIERMIWLLPGVVRVKAIVSPAESDVLQFNPSSATASIVVVVREKEPAFKPEHVRDLVAGSVAKLKAENVRVTIATELPRLTPATLPVKQIQTVHIVVISIIAALLLALLSLLGYALHVRRKKKTNPPAAGGEAVTIEPGQEIARVATLTPPENFSASNGQVASSAKSQTAETPRQLPPEGVITDDLLRVDKVKKAESKTAVGA
ncbi:MAG: hypothetical protein U0Y68_09925 [Blastocatellia bacterium]